MKLFKSTVLLSATCWGARAHCTNNQSTSFSHHKRFSNVHYRPLWPPHRQRNRHSDMGICPVSLLSSPFVVFLLTHHALLQPCRSPRLYYQGPRARDPTIRHQVARLHLRPRSNKHGKSHSHGHRHRRIQNRFPGWRSRSHGTSLRATNLPPRSTVLLAIQVED